MNDSKLPATKENVLSFIREVYGSKESYDDLIYIGSHTLTPDSDNRPKEVECKSYYTLCSEFSLKRGKRFLGEHVAVRYLIKHENNSDEAWGDIVVHRKTYRGLREEDRNAEHYLYQMKQCREQPNFYPFFQAESYLYSSLKADANFLGEFINRISGRRLRNYSSTRGSPVTMEEYKAGWWGSYDAYYGLPKEITDIMISRKIDPNGKY